VGWFFSKSGSSLFVMPTFFRWANAIDLCQRSGPGQSGALPDDLNTAEIALTVSQSELIEPLEAGC